jgi:hypothetical protein
MKLNEVESKGQYRLHISNRSAAFENLDDNLSINRAWKIPGYYELEKHKLWFEEGCSELLDQRKRAKLQWLQDPSEIRVNGDNLNNISM